MKLVKFYGKFIYEDVRLTASSNPEFVPVVIGENLALIDTDP